MTSVWEKETFLLMSNFSLITKCSEIIFSIWNKVSLKVKGKSSDNLSENTSNIKNEREAKYKEILYAFNNYRLMQNNDMHTRALDNFSTNPYLTLLPYYVST